MIGSDDGFGVRLLETRTSADSDAEQPIEWANTGVAGEASLPNPKARGTEGALAAVEPGKMFGPETPRVLRAGENLTGKRGDVSTVSP